MIADWVDVGTRYFLFHNTRLRVEEVSYPVDEAY